MSLGSTYNNNQDQNKNKYPDITVYGIRMNNSESLVDATCLTTKFWNQSLCIGIFPKKNTGNDIIAYDMDNGITIYLSYSKARILKEELELFLSDPIKYPSVGVSNGKGDAIITVSNGVDYGKNTPILTIRKVSESGETLASFAYEFKNNFYFAIRDYTPNNANFVYDEYRNLEIQQLITILEEYYKAMTNAVAFTVVEQMKYSQTRIENKTNSIMEKLGIEAPRNGNGGGRSYNNNSYFNNQAMANNNNSGGYSSPSSVSYGAATIDDLE